MAGLLNDVWRSDASGAHWYNISTAPRFGIREGHALAYHAGASALSADGRGASVFLLGGRTIVAGKNVFLNDVWRSDDGGVNWQVHNCLYAGTQQQCRALVCDSIHTAACEHAQTLALACDTVIAKFILSTAMTRCLCGSW